MNKITSVATLSVALTLAASALTVQAQSIEWSFKNQDEHSAKIERALQKQNRANAQQQQTALGPVYADKIEAMQRSVARIQTNSDEQYNDIVVYGLAKATDNTPATVYSFHLNSNLVYSSASEAEIELPSNSAFFADGKLYTFDSEDVETDEVDEYGDPIELAQLKMNVYDMDNDFAYLGTEDIEMNDVEMSVFMPTGMTYDASTGKAYLTYWTVEFDKNIAEVDIATLQARKVCDEDHNYYFMSLFAPGDGYIYGYSTTNGGKYEQVNIETGEITDLGSRPAIFQPGQPQSAFVEPVSGTIYLAGTLSNFSTHIYTVSKATGAVEKIADTVNDEQFIALYIREAKAKAPAAPTNIDFADNKLTFTAPTQTFDGEDALTSTLIDGKLKAHITVDGEEDVVEVSDGQEVEYTTELTEGLHTIKIQIENSVGLSQERILYLFVGNDVPAAVSNLELSINSDGQNELTWSASTTSLNGGPFDAASIVYDIVRMPGNVVVASDYTDTTFTEAQQSVYQKYYYIVTAKNITGEGGQATSNKVTNGTHYKPDFVETFSDEDLAELYKVVCTSENGEDYGETWSVAGAYKQNLSLDYWEGGGYDDYVTTMGIELESGAYYRLSYISTGGWGGVKHMPNVELYLTTEQSYDAEVKVALESPVFATTSEQLNSQVFSVPADGIYYLTFRASSDVYSELHIDNLSILLEADAKSPAAVTDLKATAGENGAYTNTITFKAPTLTADGSELSSITKIVLYKEGVVVKTFDAPAVGEALSYTDEDISKSGTISYSVRAFNAEGAGISAEISNYVGFDAPQAVTNLHAKLNADGSVTLTWDKVSEIGQNGGYVNPDDVVYTVDYRTQDYDEDIIASNISLLTATHTDIELTDQQEYMQYRVKAINEAGTGVTEYLKTIVGTPYELPFVESFASTNTTTTPWDELLPYYIYAWDIETGESVIAYDEDGGMLGFAGKADNGGEYTESLYIPRVALGTAQHPEFDFYMYHGADADAGDLTISVEISADDADFVTLATIDYNDGESDGWTKHVISLADYVGSENVFIRLVGYAKYTGIKTYIDALHIDESYAYDLAVQNSYIASRINFDETTTATVSVLNNGYEDASNYTINLYKDGEVVATKQGSALAQGASEEFSFEIASNKEEAKQDYEYYFVISYDADLNTANNKSDAVKLYVADSTLPTVTDLAYTAENGKVTLTWSKPENEVNDEAYEDFDDYAAFIIDEIGDWRVFDGDGATPLYFGGETMPNTYTPQAWYVWNRDEAGFSSYDVLAAHSGDQVLAAFSASDGVATATANDNWLISPSVVGGTDVSFYAKEALLKYGPETFEVLYSAVDELPDELTADFLAENFSVIGSAKVNFTEWTEFVYTLPADAKYFAIRHNTQINGEVLFIDDITYTPEFASTSELELDSYNLYCDGKLVATGITETTYTIDDDSKDHTYYVTAVWTEGESALSNGVSDEDVVVTAVQNVSAAEAGISVEGQNIVVRGAEGKVVRIYSVGGQEVFGGKPSGTQYVQVLRGLYLVSINNDVYKVLVK